MSRRRKTNGKANNSNLVGLVATIIKEGDKYVGQRVAISNVSNLSNDIVEVFLLDDKKMNKFYLPVSDLRLFSRERSQEYLLESVIDGFMGIVNKVVNGDEDWRKHANNHRHSDTSSLVQELDNIAESFGEFVKWCESNLGGKDNNEQTFNESKSDTKDDSEKNYSKHASQGSDLLELCSLFCRDYKVSPMFFISKLSEHLYCMHERYAPKDKK